MNRSYNISRLLEQQIRNQIRPRLYDRLAALLGNRLYNKFTANLYTKLEDLVRYKLGQKMLIKLINDLTKINK